MIPLIAVIDPTYVGHEQIHAELGPGYDVTIATGASEAQLRLAEADVPIVVVPETLLPEPGRVVLARLAAAHHRFIGLLLIDDARAQPPIVPGCGITHVALRPLREGEFRRLVEGAVAARAQLRAAIADGLAARRVAASLDQLLAGPLRAACRAFGVGPARAASERVLTRTAEWLRLSTRPLERTPVDPGALLQEALDAALSAHPTLNPALTLSTGGLSLGPVDPARGPRLLADARALLAALFALLDNALAHGASLCPTVSLTVEPSRVDDRHGWLFLIESDGPVVPAARLVDGVLHADGLPAFGLRLVREVVRRHGGTLELNSAPGGGLEAAVWLPETSRDEP